MTSNELIPFIERFSGASVLCVGDVMLDHFIYGDVNRISPEAPIPVVRVRHEESMLGGAGNVVRNLSSLGAHSALLTVVGADDAAGRIKNDLNNVPNCTLQAVADPSRKTSVKTRYLSGSQQLLRVDSESTHGIDTGVLDDLLSRFEELLSECDVVILSDYGKGVLKEQRAASFISAARTAGKPVFVDPKGRDFQRYRGASLIKPNLQELADAANLPVSSDAAVEAAARKVIEEDGIDALVVTRGAAGMLLVRAKGQSISLRSVAREVFDVSGAGDTVAAALAVGYATGMPIEDAMHLANIAAGLVVAKMGTATVTQEQLLSELEKSGTPADTRLAALDEALQRARLWRRLGLRVGLLQGAFEELSEADIAVIKKAREDCDRLIVVVSRRGESQRCRLQVLAAVRYVDLVMSAGHEAAESLVRELRPDVMIRKAE